jgi:predicted nuclease of restriction endonuclease-like (RecB) superfamily
MRSSQPLPVAGYDAVLRRIKERIQANRVRAALAASRNLLRVYWLTGRDIALRQEKDGWGSAVIERLARDLQAALPGLEGFSARNLWRMRAFYLAYQPTELLPHPVAGADARLLPRVVAEVAVNTQHHNVGEGVVEELPRVVAEAASNVVSHNVAEALEEDLPRVVADLPWGHHIILLEKLKDPQVRAWYAAAAVTHGWSRAVLTAQIESRLHERQGRALTNFARTLLPPQSDLAQQALKDPYVFDFLTLGREVREKEIEQHLIDHVQKFLLALGVGFAFVGRQVRLTVGEQDFYIDLLFYHLKLRCFVVLEFKTVPFEPEFAGKLNFYLSAVDSQLRHPDDKPSIGLLLCKSKDRLVVEYALRDMAKPIGVADWETRLVESLPEELKGTLPTVEELEEEFKKNGHHEDSEEPS